MPSGGNKEGIVRIKEKKKNVHVYSINLQESGRRSACIFRRQAIFLFRWSNYFFPGRSYCSKRLRAAA